MVSEYYGESPTKYRLQSASCGKIGTSEPLHATVDKKKLDFYYFLYKLVFFQSHAEVARFTTAGATQSLETLGVSSFLKKILGQHENAAMCFSILVYFQRHQGVVRFTTLDAPKGEFAKQWGIAQKKTGPARVLIIAFF